MTVHELLERLSWIAQAAIALASVGGAVFAATQLIDVRRSSQANLLLGLDGRWDSPELRDARNLFTKMTNDINEVVSTNNPTANDEARQQLVCERWRLTLSQMRREDLDNYLKLVGWMGFFETLGLMVKKKYISKQDALDLFKGPLIDIGNGFSLHIEDRCKEMGVSKGLFEHALALSKAASEAKRL